MSKTIYATALEAMNHSKKYDEITFCKNTLENLTFLKIEADGWTLDETGYDFWAEAPNNYSKMLWRVMVFRSK